MKEQPVDHVTFGLRAPQDGWHLTKFVDGIDYLPAGEGKTGYWQDDKGNMALKLPCVVDDPEDADNEGQISLVVNAGSGHRQMAGILLVVGLWDAVEKRYPGDNVTVFDAPIVEGIKVKLPGCHAMMRTEQDKKGNARPREIVSIEKYKAMADKGKTSTAAASAGKPKEKGKMVPVEGNVKDW